jgi:cytoskeletal protein RodZ
VTADAAQRAFGEFLRQARERRQLTVEQIASDTKIALRHLDALEQGSVESLPTGMYRRAMLRAYAESVGLDKRAALQQFERTFEPGGREPEPHDTATVPASGTQAGRAAAQDWRLPLVLVVLGATVVVALISGDADQDGSAGPSSAAVTRPATAPSPSPGAARQAEADAVGTTDAAALTPAVLPGAEVNDAPQAAPDAGPPPEAAGASTAGAPRAPEPAPAVRPSAGEIAIVSEPAGARVTIDGTGWGVTPVTVRHLPFGSKRIRVSRDGYASQERAISLSPDRPSARIRLTLEARD